MVEVEVEAEVEFMEGDGWDWWDGVDGEWVSGRWENGRQRVWAVKSEGSIVRIEGGDAGGIDRKVSRA